MAVFSLRPAHVDPNAASYRIEVSETSVESWFGVHSIPTLTVVIVCETADDMWNFEREKFWKAAQAIGKHCKRALFGRFRHVQIETIMRLPADDTTQPRAERNTMLRLEDLPLI